MLFQTKIEALKYAFLSGISLIFLVIASKSAAEFIPHKVFNFEKKNLLFADTLPKKDSSRKKTSERPSPKDDRKADVFAETPLSSPLLLKDPSVLKVELDSTGKFYYVYEKIGETDFKPLTKISTEDYAQIEKIRAEREYWKVKSTDLPDPAKQPGGFKPVLSGKLPPALGRLLGGDKIEVKPTGSILLDFGGRFQSVANPMIPVRQQKTGQFNFDQRIQLGIVGKIGEKINLNTNWDTKATFQFENKFNQGYSGYEEDIVQQLQFGNVSMPTSNSLIRGAQNLFGVGTKLRFGKLWLTAVASQQRGTSESIVIKGGGQNKAFEIRADAYEYNRHFFLAHFFRNNYENALRTLPVVTSGINITRVEVYITNRNNNTQTLRNIAAFMDLGESAPYRKGNAMIEPSIFGAASNQSNKLKENLNAVPTIRQPDQIHTVLESAPFDFRKGTDYELLRAARKLQPNEFTFHPQLGYISLLQPVRNDEIIAVSYEYTYQGKVYRVGELTEDYQNNPDTETVVMKMLRPSTIRTDLPMWDLMMKNIYNLNAPQIQQLNFQFRIMYRDDMTGIDNPSLHEGIQTQNRPLLQIFGLDRLNPNNDPQPDGNFDFVPSLTIDPTAGRIIFPVLEPFGSNLKAYFEPSLELQLINKYVFQELYTGTQADAQLLTNKSKFFLKGSYMSSTSNEIILPGMNIAPQSVSVRAGNTLLTEGADYTVDYQLGRVRLTNTGVLSSGKDIIIQYERADLFNFQQRNFMGLEAEYRFNKDFKIVGTVLHLNERPLITRVTMNNEPLRNTLWGIAGNYRKESGFLTRMVDKIPFVDTKEKSVFAFSGEFAQLIPGTNQMLKQNGSVETSYIDDFESSEIPYELGRMPTAWRLGSTPRNLIPNGGFANPLDYNNLRANLTWYSIDNTAFYSGGFQGSAPDNITEEDKLNHYTRMVLYNEIAKGRDAQQVNLPEQTFDLAFYPEERGAYNFNTNLLRNGKLPSPEKNFGSITRGITHDIDFDNINVQYLEFWLLDPFLTGKNGQIIYQDLDGLNKGVNNVSGGDLEIHLGNISEDVIPDGRHNFENGIPTDGNPDQIAKTAWGNAPKQQYLTDAFAAGSDSRGKQDIGLDGATDEEERIFFKDYIEEIKTKLNDLSLSRITEDPAGDNFKHFLDGNYTDKNAKILTRYTRFNNMQGNSPENSGNNSSYQTPDNEDLNRDNTISDLESFYKYKISIKPGMLEKGVNPYVVAQVTTKAKKSNDEITWYQFRIPIREFQEKYGDIDGFKSIRFVRLFMQGWTQPVVLRMSQFQFVGAQWRPYLGDLQTPGLNKPLEPYNPSFTVGTVNIERNGLFDGKNTPYMLPPGFKRDVDPTSVTQARQNEQSLRVCVEGLQDTDSRGVFKNMNFDFVNYKRVQMFIHAESDDAKDEEMSAFLRLGTDFKENFYEVEVPLVMTPKGSTGERQVWPLENEIDFELSNFINIKAERNKKRLSMTVPYTVKIGRYNVTVVGNPDLSNLQTAMLGVRNPRSADELPRSVCVWFNELRVAEFNKEAGWAANARLQMQLADFAQINASLRYSTPFFGGLQDKISQRSRETIFYYDVNSTVNLDKILLNRIGISLPMFVSYEQSLTTPLFNPLDPDTRLDQSMDTRFQDNKDDFMSKVQARLTRKSINFTNVRKTKVNPKAQKHFYDVENWAFTYSYADEVQSDIQIAVRERMNSKIGLNYAYSFEAKPWKPLSKSELFNSPYLKLLRDFNFTLTPQTIGFNGVLNRNYTKMQMRNAELTTAGMPAFFEKSYMFDRNYNARWKFTDGLTFDYNSAVNAIIDEPEGEINTEVKRDSVMNNLRKLGRTKFFKQDVVFNYKLPLEKIPFTDFISADAKYNAGYQWSAGAVGMADTLGNLARNTNQFTLAGQINMQKLYDKSPLLKQLTASGKTKPSSKAAKTEDEKTKRLKFRLSKISEKKSKNAKKREEKKLLRLQALKNDYSRKSAADSLISVPADSLFADSLFYADILGKYWKKQNKYLKRQNRLEEKLKKHAQKLTEKAAKEQNQPASPALNTIAKVLFSVKKINITYNSNRATNLPGYLPRPSYFGLNENLDMASLPFILGGQSRNMILDMAAKGLISKSSVQTMPYQQTLDKKINLTATVEPTKGFQLTIEASRANGAAFSEIIRYDPTAEQYNFESATRNGNYTISFITLRTAFDRVDAQKNSPVFDKFIAARGDVKAFLDAQNPEGPYLANSQDVILPAFLQAYTGKKQKSPSAFPQIPLPNWRLNYSGLSELEMFKNIFSSITLSHGYSASYSTGNFTSSLLYDADYINLDISEANMLYGRRDPVTGVLVPVLVMNQVSVTEKFSPLVGFNIKTKSDITARIDFNKQRSLTMNLNNAQLTEIKSSDITIDVGLRKKNFKIPFTETVLKNDLTFRFALTLRDNVTYQRRIENEKQLTTVTAGNMNLRINPTLAYMVTKQLTTTAYFDYSLNNPVISNSFRRTNTNFGIQLLYRLAP